MNRLQLETETSKLLADPANTRWSTGNIDLRLDEAQIAVQIDAAAVEYVETLTPTANVNTVPINNLTLDILRATWTDTSGNVIPLEGKTRREVDFERSNWQNETSNNAPDTWFPDFSKAQLWLVPAPSAAVISANCLTLYEIRQPTALTGAAGTAIPFDSNLLMVPFHMALCLWAAAQCLLDNGDQESIQKSLAYRSGNLDRPGQYEIWLKKIISKFNKPKGAPAKILWRPQGGRLGGWPVSKSTPLG